MEAVDGGTYLAADVIQRIKHGKSELSLTGSLEAAGRNLYLPGDR